MSGKKISSHAHIVMEDRITIQGFLDQGTRLKDLAGQIKKHPSSVANEIKRFRTHRFAARYNDLAKNNCIYRKNCFKRDICKQGCRRRCSACSKCNQYCPGFVRDECQTPLRFPFVCNACPTKKGCRKDKFFYTASVAHAMSQALRKSSRTGIDLSEQQLLDLDLLLTPLIQKGQPINHIFATQKSKIPCSKRTIYRYIDLGYLATKNIDLRRKVSYKPRKSRKKKATNPAYRKNRSYADFLVHVGYHPDRQIVEMDTVIGRIGGKAFLTMHFRNLDLLLIFLLPKNNQTAVLEVFDFLENTLGSRLFQACFPVILTDNGAEFQNPDILEMNAATKQRCRIFYCDPMASWQKGRIEKAHEFIRYVLPKGSSFDGLSQDDADLLMNHINCTCRDGLGDKSPYDIACATMNDMVVLLELYQVPADQVNLKPSLLKP